MIGSELVREDDGLAMSSRNVLLSHEDRKKVPPVLLHTDHSFVLRPRKQVDMLLVLLTCYDLSISLSSQIGSFDA